MFKTESRMRMHTCITEIVNYVLSDSLLTGIFIAVVLYMMQMKFDFYLFKIDHRDANDPSTEEFSKHIDTTHCIDAKCVRCHKYRSILNTAHRKLETLEDDRSCTNNIVIVRNNTSNSTRGEMKKAIEKCRLSLMNEIPLDITETDMDQNPNVYLHNSLTSKTLWTEADISNEVQNDVNKLEEGLNGILTDFMQIYTDKFIHLWKRNSTDSGSWDVFHLMNQGTWIKENASLCPKTTRTVQQLSCIMTENVFGNVLFSVIKPATFISPHYGPTNLRLRCHLGLVTNNECVLHVGSDHTTWSDGKCIVFDDSFLHSVEHLGNYRPLLRGNEEENDSTLSLDGSLLEQGDRAVLIVDLWHPKVSDMEQCILNYLFSPDLDKEDG